LRDNVEGFGGKEGCNGGIVETMGGFGLCVRSTLAGLELVRLGALIMIAPVSAGRERGAVGVECGIGPAEEPDLIVPFRSTAADCGVLRCPSTISGAEDVSVIECEGGLAAIIDAIDSVVHEEDSAPAWERSRDVAFVEMTADSLTGARLGLEESASRMVPVIAAIGDVGARSLAPATAA